MNYPTIEEFIGDWGKFPNNKHVSHEDWETFYLRRGPRFVRGVRYERVIDLANIEAKNPGTGAFTRLVKHLRDTYPDIGLYVESVMNRRFKEYLPKLGFVCAMDNEFSPCFFLPPLEKE